MTQRTLAPILSMTLVLALSGCGMFRSDSEPKPGPITGRDGPLPAAETSDQGSTVSLGASAARAADLDTTTEAEKAAARAAGATAGGTALGRVIVALGPPAEQGLWLSTELVREVSQGRVVTAAGDSLAVELRPGTGGALLSLAAFQALKLPLTALPEVTVYGP